MEGMTYTKVENYLIHALCRVRVSPGVLQTVLAICRLTIGFHLESRHLRYEQITRITGFSRQHQFHYVKQALKFNMIERFNARSELDLGKKPQYVYSLNLDPLTWNVPMRFPDRHFNPQSLKQRCSPSRLQDVAQTGYKDVAQTGYKILGKLLKNPWDSGSN